MADRILASYETPGYKENQAQQLGAILAMAGQTFRKRQEERKERDLANIQQFLDIASKKPELAAGPYAQEMKRKYGKDYPQVAALIDTLANEGQIAQQMEGAGKKWLSTADQLWGEIEGKKAQAAQQSDAVPTHWGMPVPNLAKLALQRDLEQIDPNQVFLTAAQKMKPSERYQAQAWAKVNKGEFPDIGMGWIADPSKMPQDVQALMGAMGTSDPAKVKGDILSLIGLAPRAGVQQETTFRVDENIREAEERQKIDIAERERAHELGAIDEKTRHQNRVDEDARRHAQQMSEIAARQADDGAADAGDPLWKKVLKWQGASVKDYDARLKTNLQGEAAEGKAAIKKGFLAEEGVRPRTLNPAQAKQVERETAALVKAGIVSPENAESFALRAASRFNAITARETKKEPQAALNEALMHESITQALRAQGVSEEELGGAHWQTRQRFYSLRKKGASRTDALAQSMTVPYEEVKATSNAGRALATKRWEGKKAAPANGETQAPKKYSRAEVEARVKARMPNASGEEISAAVDRVMQAQGAE